MIFNLSPLGTSVSIGGNKVGRSLIAQHKTEGAWLYSDSGVIRMQESDLQGIHCL